MSYNPLISGLAFPRPAERCRSAGQTEPEKPRHKRTDSGSTMLSVGRSEAVDRRHRERLRVFSVGDRAERRQVTTSFEKENSGRVEREPADSGSAG